MSIAPPTSLFPVSGIINDPLSYTDHTKPAEEHTSQPQPQYTHTTQSHTEHTSSASEADISNSFSPVVPILTSRPIKHRSVPTKFQDYVGLPPTLHTAQTVFQPSYQHFMAAVSKILEPYSYQEAIQYPEWCTVMATEMAALEANNTWVVTPLPTGKKPFGCRWLYKVKYQPDGTVERYKARLVAKGYTQTEGLDYFETFAHVVKMTTLRTLLIVAAIQGWSLTQLDVTNAFLHGDLHEDVYMTLPQGYIPSATILQNFASQNIVCKLIKSLYGLKQAPRCWFVKLCLALLAFGFKQSACDHSMFVYIHKGSYYSTTCVR